MYSVGLWLFGVGAILGAADAPWTPFVLSKVASLLCLGGAVYIFIREGGER